MSRCVNKSHKYVEELAQKKQLSIEEVAADIALWQEKNNTTTVFPEMSELYKEEKIKESPKNEEIIIRSTKPLNEFKGKLKGVSGYILDKMIESAPENIMVHMVEPMEGKNGLLSGNNIYIGTNSTNIERTLLHEVGHAATIYANANWRSLPETTEGEKAKKQKVSEAISNINRLFHILDTQSRKHKKDFHEFFDAYKPEERVAEFITEMLSNKSLQRFASTIRLRQKTTVKSLLSAFTTQVKKLLGFDVEYDTLLDEALENILVLMDSNLEAYNPNIKFESEQKNETAIKSLREKAEARGIKTVINEITGEEEDYYTDNSDGRIRRMTNRVVGLMASFTPDPYTIEQKAEFEAFYEFGGDDITKKKTKRFAKLLNKQEFIQAYLNEMTAKRLRGKIFHGVAEYVNTGESNNNLFLLINRWKEKYFNITGKTLATDWITKSLFNSLYESLGVTREADIQHEVPVFDDILKVAGTVDCLIDHGDNHFSVIDFKFGDAFSSLSSKIMKYSLNTLATSKEIASMQVMMYAFITKLNITDATFKDLVIKHIRNTDSTAGLNTDDFVDPTKYLPILIKYLQDKDAQINEGIITSDQLSLYDQLVAKHGLEPFNVKNYMKFSKNLVTQDVIKQRQKDALDTLNKFGNTNIAEEAPGKDSVYYSPIYQEEYREKLINAMKVLMESNASSELYLNNNVKDMDKWKSILGNYTNTDDPYIKVFFKLYKVAEETATNNQEAYVKQMNNLFEKAFGNKSSKYQIVDYRDFYSKFMVTEIVDGIERERLAIKPEEMINFTEAEKEFLVFLNETYKDLFKNYYETEINSKHTHLSLYNIKTLNAADKFEYYDGWFPKIPMETIEREKMLLSQGNYVGKKIQYNLKNIFTFAMEDLFENENMKDSLAIPIKYLDKQNIVAEKFYSMNLVAGFNAFVGHTMYKQQMDPIFGLSRALSIFYKTRTRVDKEGEEIQDPLNNSAKFIKDQADILIRHVRRNYLDELTKHQITIGNQKVSISKGLHKASIGFSKGIMAFRTLQPVGNMIQGRLLQNKEAWSEWAAFKLLGGSIGDNKTLSLKAENLAWNAWGAAAMGKENENKLWMIASKMDMIPSFEFQYKKKHIRLQNQNLEGVDSQTPMVAYQMGEETLALAILATQLMSMKVGDKSVYDLYEIENGELVWKGGIRGYRSIGKNEYERLEPITELTQEEKAKMRKLHSKIQGNYRKDEQTALDLYTEAKMFFMMKRFILQLVINSFEPGSNVYELGNWKPIGKTEDDVDIYEWHAGQTKGKLRSVVKLILVGLAKVTGNKKLQKDFDDLDKKNLVDFGMTMGLLMISIAAYVTLFDDDDDDNTLKKAWRYYLIDNLGQQYNIYDMLDSVKNMAVPIVLDKSSNLLTGFVVLMSAMFNEMLNEESMYNQEGHIKGLDQVLKSIPATAPFMDYIKKIENIESNR